MKPETKRIALSMRSAMQQAGFVAAALQNDLVITDKGALDILTDADTASEKILTRWYRETFPDDGITGEEGTEFASRSGSKGYLDPVDGTKNFASGLPMFGISVGRADENGIPELGGLFFVEHNEFVFAARDEGTWIVMGANEEFTPLARKPFPRRLARSVIGLGLTPSYRHLFEVFQKICWNSIMLGSCTYEAFKLVIQGQCSAYIHTGPTSFDIAAVAIIAKEAGCAVTPVDLRREKMYPFVVAQNEEILEKVLGLCQFPIV